MPQILCTAAPEIQSLSSLAARLSTHPCNTRTNKINTILNKAITNSHSSSWLATWFKTLWVSNLRSRCRIASPRPWTSSSRTWRISWISAWIHIHSNATQARQQRLSFKIPIASRCRTVSSWRYLTSYWAHRLVKSLNASPTSYLTICLKSPVQHGLPHWSSNNNSKTVVSNSSGGKSTWKVKSPRVVTSSLALRRKTSRRWSSTWCSKWITKVAKGTINEDVDVLLRATTLCSKCDFVTITKNKPYYFLQQRDTRFSINGWIQPIMARHYIAYKCQISHKVYSSVV